MIDSRFFRQECYIDGAWIGADETIPVDNPATGEVIGTVPKFARKETAKAIDAAHAAFADWRGRPAAERAAYCLKIHDALMANQEELGRLLTIEMGKPLAEAKGEVAYAAAFFKWFGEEARRVYGDVVPSPWADKRIVVTKEPVGVVGSITPWNFPTAMIARKAAAALAAGCTVVAKPASQTPYSALAYGVIAEEIGLPKGVLNILTGSAAAIGDELCENPKVRKITFTGSTPVGKELASKATKHMKRVSMELGGNAPFIVFDDADLDRAVAGAVASKYRNSGQTCVCSNRIYVQAGVYDVFAEKLAAAAKALKVGDGLEPGVQQGPLIDEAGVRKVEEHIEDATKKGAKVILGGKRREGLWFEPTVLTGVTADMLVAREETFGPLAPLFRFETEEEAIRLANDTEYGLAAYFYTRDLGRAFRVMEALEYGIVGVNEGIISTEVAPFGGVKDSGMGREGSKYGLDDYLNIKYGLIGGL
ncbi:NAD-dependent succinate-semialdehyde dehydrogenase [Amphiplicatus metriothermophilus]|uniref:Succinate semialdehyde dehydrogenase n=1 Tax=Amphiplicatus metriothermophilus TaxID=1519374 RepID=A0A239PQN7_9PROT|nr:NAD-dependent succinate-semialdehyde dehydrogenase [Amphiplicatus metriothermophilus]MBB5518589.1 succinate-semialdehyde dehydrogenase/glutarate-semialdehyde dehydrogenase [Amphiplicatus metriothermophilus]SNT72252.1 succinate semialdehyde dehydrogenase [Amphiplicatus metriothermophilus]